MRNIIRHAKAIAFAAGLAGSFAVTEPAFVGFARAEAPAADKAVKPDLKKLNEHLVQHQTYPATRAQLLAACKGLVDFSPGEKRWFAAHLPEGTYGSGAEVMAAVTGK